ncbi:hypothetical protein ACFL3G_13525 [Planctomycetota bacterium]
MKKQEQKQIITIDEFSSYVSLNNIIAGDNAVSKLKKIAIFIVAPIYTDSML